MFETTTPTSSTEGLRRADLVAAVCGSLVALLGLAVMLAWILQQPWIIRLHQSDSVMRFLTAAGFCLVGLTLAAQGLRQLRLSLVLGLLAAAAGWFSCADHVFGIQTSFDRFGAYVPRLPGQSLKPSLPTSLVFALNGTALAVLAMGKCRSLHCPLAWMVGASSLSLSVVGLFGYIMGLVGTDAWKQFAGVSLHSVLAIFTLSVGLFAATIRSARRASPQEDPWFPVPFAVGGVVATLLLWQALVADHRNHEAAEAATTAENLVRSVSTPLESRLRGIERMALRWESRNGTPEYEWQQDANALIRAEKIFVAFERVSADGNERWLASGHRLLLQELSEDNQRIIAEMVAQAREPRESILSPVVWTKDHRPLLLACVALRSQASLDGHIIAAIDIQQLFDAMVLQSHAEEYIVSVKENDSVIFTANADKKAMRGGVEAAATLAMQGRRWDFTIASIAETSGGQHRLPHLVLVFGLGCTALLALSALALRQMRKHSRATHRAHVSLQTEMQERLEVQKKLRESEERLRTVLDSATGVSVIGADPAGIVTFFSRGAEELLGYQAEEIVGGTSEIFHDAEEVKHRGEELTCLLGREIRGFEAFVAIPKKEGSERREWTYVCKDGTHKTVELTVTVLYDAAHNATGFLGTAIDVTGRKRMEQQLRKTVRAEQNARALLDAAGRIAKLGHWEFLLDGGGLKWSDTTYAIYEVEPGTPLTVEEALNFFAPAERPIVERSVQQAMIEGEIFEFEARITTGTGRQRWIHSRGEPVRDQLGNIIALRGVVQDVDEPHMAAELLTRRNWELEVATAQAQAHAKAKAEFLANMSHEIRTPLNAVLGMSELLHDTSLNERQLDYVNTIRMSGDTLLGIINDILDFSKIEAGQLRMERIPFDLRECVESSFDLVSSQASRKKLDLLYWIEPTVPASVMGDPTRLRQILVNFISNAVKFTEKGEVFVRINRTTHGKAAEKLHISVRDTGIGISPEHQHRLFQSFSQVDSSTSRKYGGTGLGLAICHRLITMMEGRVWVESQTGNGADFQFEIPLLPAEATPPQVYQRGQGGELQGLRVLVVDDNETNRWILESQSKAWGMVPRTTALPTEALSWIEQGDPFDIAILDGHMPGMSGFELAEKINAKVSLQQMPVLMLTSMGDTDSITEKPGVSAILAKPVKTHALYESLSRLLLGNGGPVRRKAPSNTSNPQFALEHPLKILVAEDNPVNQRVISLLLERLGYRIEIAANGLEVLAALERTNFDLILMDVQMPEMDGLQAAREICRLHHRDQRPRMVALTANAVTGDRENCLAAGMDAYLSKPVRGNELAAALRETFEERKKMAESATPVS